MGLIGSLLFAIFDLIWFIVTLPFKIIGAIFGIGGASCPRCGSKNVSKMRNGGGVCGDCGYREG